MATVIKSAVIAVISAGVLSLYGCSKEDLKDAADTITGDGPSIGSADQIKFVSDIDWLAEYFGVLDQASLPWVWGTFLFFEEVGGISGIPVLFDHANPPEVLADIKIEVAGSEKLGKRAPLTIFDGKDVPLELIQMSAIISVGADTATYEKFPDSFPAPIGGKTVFPWRFLITMDQFDWSTAGADSQAQLKNALNAGDLNTESGNVSDKTPVPWLDCETTKITIGLKGSAEGDNYQVQHTKFMAGDPKVTIKLLGLLTDTAGPILQESTGFDLGKLKDALAGASENAPDCEEPDDADKALFDTPAVE